MSIKAEYTKERGLNQSSFSSFSTATIDLTTDITLTSTIEGVSRNATTFQLITLDRAANQDDAVLVAFTGDRDAIVCTVTPDDNPISITSAQLVELINTGSVVGKTITLTDTSGLRTLQTASGGGGETLASAGQGNQGANVTATFARMPAGIFSLPKIGVSFDREIVRAAEYSITTVADVAKSLQDKVFTLDSGNGLVKFGLKIDTDVPDVDVNITLAENDGAAAVAGKVATAINNLAGFTSSDAGDDVTVLTVKTGLTKQADHLVNTAGFTITVDAEGSGAAYGVINSTGVTVIDRNHAGAAAFELGNLTAAEAGAIKLVIQTHAGAGNHDLTVKKHITQNDAIVRFAGTEQRSLIWLGDKWSNVLGTDGTDLNTAALNP